MLVLINILSKARFEPSLICYRSLRISEERNLADKAEQERQKEREEGEKEEKGEERKEREEKEEKKQQSFRFRVGEGREPAAKVSGRFSRWRWRRRRRWRQEQLGRGAVGVLREHEQEVDASGCPYGQDEEEE